MSPALLSLLVVAWCFPHTSLSLSPLFPPPPTYSSYLSLVSPYLRASSPLPLTPLAAEELMETGAKFNSYKVIADVFHKAIEYDNVSKDQASSLKATAMKAMSKCRGVSDSKVRKIHRSTEGGCEELWLDRVARRDVRNVKSILSKLPSSSVSQEETTRDSKVSKVSESAMRTTREFLRETRGVSDADVLLECVTIYGWYCDKILKALREEEARREVKVNVMECFNQRSNRHSNDSTAPDPPGCTPTKSIISEAERYLSDLEVSLLSSSLRSSCGRYASADKANDVRRSLYKFRRGRSGKGGGSADEGTSGFEEFRDLVMAGVNVVPYSDSARHIASLESCGALSSIRVTFGDSYYSGVVNDCVSRSVELLERSKDPGCGDAGGGTLKGLSEIASRSNSSESYYRMLSYLNTLPNSRSYHFFKLLTDSAHRGGVPVTREIAEEVIDRITMVGRSCPSPGSSNRDGGGRMRRTFEFMGGTVTSIYDLCRYDPVLVTSVKYARDWRSILSSTPVGMRTREFKLGLMERFGNVVAKYFHYTNEADMAGYQLHAIQGKEEALAAIKSIEDEGERDRAVEIFCGRMGGHWREIHKEGLRLTPQAVRNVVECWKYERLCGAQSAQGAEGRRPYESPSSATRSRRRSAIDFGIPELFKISSASSPPALRTAQASRVYNAAAASALIEFSRTNDWPDAVELTRHLGNLSGCETKLMKMCCSTSDVETIHELMRFVKSKREPLEVEKMYVAWCECSRIVAGARAGGGGDQGSSAEAPTDPRSKSLESLSLITPLIISSSEKSINLPDRFLSAAIEAFVTENRQDDAVNIFEEWRHHGHSINKGNVVR